MKKIIGVFTLALCLSGSALYNANLNSLGTAGLTVDGSLTLGRPGVTLDDGASPPNQSPTINLAVSTTDSITYRILLSASDADGTVDSVHLFVTDSGVNADFNEGGTVAAYDTVDVTLDPDVYTITGLAFDDDGASGFTQVTNVKRPDVRTVNSELTYASLLSAETLNYPVTVMTVDSGLLGTNINQVSDYSDTNVTRVLDLMDDVDGINVEMSRAFTAAGAAFLDSCIARNSDLIVQHYIRFDHAPLDTTLASQDLSTAEANAGPIIYRVDSIGHSYRAFESDGSTRAAIFGDGSGNPSYWHWNHWETRGPEDPPGYNRALVTAYSDSLARMLNRYPDVRVSMVFLDFFPDSPNVLVQGSSPESYVGEIDYDNDGTADYSSYSWIDTDIRDGFYAWLTFHAEAMDDLLPYTRIIPNGNFLDSTDDYGTARVEALLPQIDGFNGESLILGNGDFPNSFSGTYERILLADLYSTIRGKEFNQFGTSGGTTVTDPALRAKYTAILSLLGKAQTLLRGQRLRTYDQVSAAITELANINAGRPVGGLQARSALSGTATELYRDYTNGRASAIFSDASGSWQLVTPLSSTVTWTEWTVNADFTATSIDNLEYDFESTSTTDDISGITSYSWLLGDPGLSDYSTRSFSHIFTPSDAIDDSVEVKLDVITSSGKFGSITKKVYVAADVPPDNVAPTAFFTPETSDNLNYVFDVSGSSDSDGQVVNYDIDYGDGTDEQDQFGASSTNNLYEFDKLYSPFGDSLTVTLIVTDNDGAADTLATVIPIADPPAGTPAITGVSGTFDDGAEITITGANFGAIGPVVEIYDDFEAGTNGSLIVTNGTGAAVGGWDSGDDLGTDHFVYSTTKAFSGTKSGRVDHTSGFGVRLFETFDSPLRVGDPVYYSAWVQIPSDGFWPGEPNNINFKMMWLWGSGDNGIGATADDDVVLPTFGGASESLLRTFLFSNDSGTTSNGTYANPSYTKGTWARYEGYLVPGDNFDGIARVIQWTPANKQRTLMDVSDREIFDGAEAGTEEIVTFAVNGFNNQSQAGFFYYDDILIQTGDSAQARVVLADNSDYTQASKFGIATPTAWTNGQITANLRTGNFVTDDTAYVFVVTKENIFSVGEAITIGGTGDAPSAPDITSITPSDATPSTADEVTFSFGNDGSAPTSYLWELGDGTDISTAANGAYTFSSAGTYAVKLTATNSAGVDTFTCADCVTSSAPATPPSITAFNKDQGDSLTTVRLGPVSVTAGDAAVDSLRFTPWVGSYTRGIAYTGTAADTVIVDYTSQQEASNTTETATVAAVDEDSEQDTDTTSITVKGSGGGGGSLPINEGFEDGALPDGWSISDDSGTSNLVQSTSVTNTSATFSADTGSWHLRTTYTSGVGYAYIDIPVDLDGVSNVYVSARLYCTDQTGFNSTEGFYLSDNSGSTFTKISGEGFNASSGSEPDNTWYTDTCDIDADAGTAGVSLNANNVLRIVYRVADSGELIGWDNITIAEGDIP